MGATVSATDTTLNQGGGGVTVSTFTRFYLSTTASWTPASVLLASRAVPPLGAGAGSSGATPVEIPAGTAPGSYFLLAFADASGAAAEGSESNNSVANSIQVVTSTPDLIVSALGSPPTAAAGGTISVDDTTKNQGTGGVTVSTWTRFYLSATPYWTSASVLLNSRSVGPLTAGATSAGTTPATIPAGTAAGSYFLLAFADASGAVTESNEGNQHRANALQVTAGSGLPDLVVSDLITPVSAATGATISVGDTTKNQGTGGVTVSTWTRFYLSATPYWTSASVLLNSRSVGPLTAGATSAGTTPATIPAGTAAGSYFLLAFADASGAVTESNEGNQHRANALQVTAGSGLPDLVVSDLITPASAATGATISVGDTTKNQGTGGVTVSTWTRFYLSATPYWTSASVLLNSRSVGPLTAGATSAGTTPATIPAGTAAGKLLPAGVCGRLRSGHRVERGEPAPGERAPGHGRERAARPGGIGPDHSGQRGDGRDDLRRGHDEEPGDGGRDGLHVDALLPVGHAVLDVGVGLAEQPERGAADGRGHQRRDDDGDHPSWDLARSLLPSGVQ